MLQPLGSPILPIFFGLATIFPLCTEILLLATKSENFGSNWPKVFSELSPVLCWGISKYQIPVTMKKKLPEGSLMTNLTACKDTTLYRPLRGTSQPRDT